MVKLLKNFLLGKPQKKSIFNLNPHGELNGSLNFTVGKKVKKKICFLNGTAYSPLPP